jgi:repressor LexA
MTRLLTSHQREFLQFMQDYIKDKGWPPSVREIADHFGWNSTNAAADFLRRLSNKGYVTVAPKVARGIRLTEKALTELAPPTPPEVLP